MAYTYKYIPSGDALQVSAQEEYHRLVQEDLNQMFYESDDTYEVLEETGVGTGAYRKVDIRSNVVVNMLTGERNGNDFRKFLFKDLDHPVQLGLHYQFESNQWLTINVEKIHQHTPTCTVKRCNNTLRWIDPLGGYHSVPCSIGYLIKENRDYSTAGSQMVVPSGMIEVLVQGNDVTRTLKPNQRFLFGSSGQFTAYRIEGGGFANFNNQITLDNNSAGLIRLSMAVDFLNEQTDDLVNGIADVNEQIYTLTLNESAISGDVGQTVQLQAVTVLNGGVVSRTVTWSSNYTDIATVNSSGLVTFIAEGTATITASLANNSSVSDTCSVVVGVSPVDIYQLRVSPSTNQILEGATQVWTAYLYKNNVQQADVVTFSLDPNTVPADHYTYLVMSDNSFGISNLEMFLTDTLDVTATSGIYSVVISISLRGAW
jgi:hypothetical protein